MLSRMLQMGPLFVIAAALIWSLDGVLRTNLYTVSPVIVVFWEHVIGALILTPIFLRSVGDLRNMQRKQWIAIAVVALFSGALGAILYTAALAKIQYTQYSVVVLLQQQLQPIWAICAAAFLVKEKLSKKFLLWALLAIAAAYFVTFKDLRVNLSTGDGTLMAGLFALSAGLMWGSSTAISKYVLNKVSFVTATALRFYLAPFFAFLMVPFVTSYSAMTQVSGTQWVNLLIIALSTGMVALLLYYYGLKKTPARVTTICELVWPASAVLIDYFYFQKTLSVTQIIGIAVLLFAIYRISKYEAVVDTLPAKV